MRHRLLAGLAIAPLVLAALTATAAAASTVRVTTLSGSQGWRVSPFNAGEVAISGAVDDPVHRNGSLLLENLNGGARAQAQLPLIAPLSQVADRPISYSAYVASGDAPQYGVNLQLEIAGGNFFTTLSYQPQLAGGLGIGAWRSFANRNNAPVWWSSRAFGTIPSNQPVSLADMVAAQGPNAHVINVYLNVSAALAAYADNVTVNGAHYDFVATPKPLTVSYDMLCDLTGGGTVTFRATNNTASTQQLDVHSTGLTPATLHLTVPANGTTEAHAHIGTEPTVVTTHRVGGGSKSATLHGCPAATDHEPTAPEQTGDLTPGIPGHAGGGFTAVRQGPQQPAAVKMAAATDRSPGQATNAVAALAGGTLAAAAAGVSGTAMVRRRRGIRR